MGATGVTVAGLGSFDVEFLDGSCAGLFSGCDEPSDFTFTNATDAGAAATALLAQVLIDDTAGSGIDFDTSFWLVNGCGPTDAEACSALIPYELDGSNIDMAAAENSIEEPFDGTFSTSPGLPFTTVGSPHETFARFTAATAIAEPASLALFGMAFAGLIAVRRRHDF
ncbi:MAG: PEP-CTERM sorting domain-containing protein [Alphaproteobacteria bacterium]|nr:PEP-CTERM sorting domain-containing protein [Alphaproteobacteria bacterium]